MILDSGLLFWATRAVFRPVAYDLLDRNSFKSYVFSNVLN